MNATAYTYVLSLLSGKAELLLRAKISLLQLKNYATLILNVELDSAVRNLTTERESSKKIAKTPLTGVKTCHVLNILKFTS